MVYLKFTHYILNLFTKKKEKQKSSSFILLLLLTTIYRALTMCQALCFMYIVTNPLGNFIGQGLIYLF